MTKAISETVSQNRKRGRPRCEWLAHGVAFAEGMGCCVNAQSRRGKQDIAYRQLAVNALVGHPEAAAFAWLADMSKMQLGVAGAWQPTILTELGRFDDPDQMIEVARQLCELQPHPTARDAVAMIRRWRLGTQPAADAHQLSVSIANTVQRYIADHRDVDKGTVLAALGHVAETIKDMDWN